ncbi:MAG: hypothetical protein ACXABY_35710 [Candidatus Thorarchaeota archaeon]|jgi:hypothetical protein
MTFDRKKILWWGLGILIAFLFCLGMCGNKPYSPANKANKIVDTQGAKCQGMLNGFQKFLDTTAREVVENTAGKNIDVLELTPVASMLECISDTRVKLKVDTYIKLKTRLVDPKTKKVSVVIECGQGSDEITLQQKGSFVRSVDSDKESNPMKIVPCK